MAVTHTFTIKHYPVNDLLAPDLQEHLDSVAKFGREMFGTQQLVIENSPATP